MKKFITAMVFCLLLITPAAANDQMDYLNIEKSLKEDLLDFRYAYPQITQGESRLTTQRLNGFLREYSLQTALDARLNSRKTAQMVQGSTSFLVTRNDTEYFSIVFTTTDTLGQNRQRGFAFLPADGKRLRLCDLFISEDYLLTLQAQVAEKSESTPALKAISPNQSFYITGDELVILYPGEEENTTMGISIPLEQLSGILCESLLKSVRQ